MVEAPPTGPDEDDHEDREETRFGPVDLDLDLDDRVAEPIAEGAAPGRPAFGLVGDREVVQAAAARERDGSEPRLFASILDLVDDAASRLLDHPIRPRMRVSPGGLLRGEIDVLRIEVPAVLAAGLVLDRLVLRAERVRVSPGLPPRLRAGPVTLRAYVCQDNVDRWVRTSHLPITLRLTPEGVVLTTGLGGFRMTETLADLEVTGSFLRLAPRRMTVVGLPTPLVRFFRGYLPLPPLPRGARLTGVGHGDGELSATFTFDEVDEPLTPDIARRLGLTTRLPIPGLR